MGVGYERGDGALYLQWASMYMGTEGGLGGGRVAPSLRAGFWGDSIVYHPLRLRGA